MSDLAQYEIRLRGHLDPRRAWQFEGLQVSLLPEGDTLLRGPLVDQAALHGVLSRIRDLGVVLVYVRRLDAPAGEGC